MFDQAHQLHQAHVLERIVTAVPRSRVGLPATHVKTRLRRSIVRRAVGPRVPRMDPALSRAVVKDFDRWAYAHLGDPSLVNGLSGFATETLSRVAKRGVTVCCDRGSWHIIEQQRVLDEEAERIAAPRVWFDKFMVDRELTEYELADRIIVPSEVVRQSFIRQGVNGHRVIKVPYGVDISAFSVPSGERHPGAIVSVATVGLCKGHHYLVEAFRMLRTREATLTLVGSVTPGWDERLNLGQKGIRATGPVRRARVVEELQKASIFVLASILDGFGLVIAQAMACGLPVIATEATGIRELVDDGVEGIVVPSADPVALATALDFLLAHPEQARAMGVAARQKVETIGGWDRYGRQMLAAMRSALGERP